MPGDEDSLFGLLRGDLAEFRREMNQRLDRLVTQDAFEAERRRVDERHAQLGQDLVDEREARVLADKNERDARKQAQAELDKKAAATGLWIRWGVSLVVGIPAALVAMWALFLRGPA